MTDMLPPGGADGMLLDSGGFGLGDGEDTPPPPALRAVPLAAKAAVCDSPEQAQGGSLSCNSARPSRRTSRTAFADLPPEPDDPLLGFAPYLHKAPRRNSITPDRQREFIAVLAATGIVTQAARGIGASLEALYRLRNQPGAEGFAAAWEAAIDRGVARLEDCALERALHGEERLVVRSGEVVARWHHYDNALLMFVLRQRRARRWNAEGGHFANLRPGHPVYDRLKADWERERAIAEAADGERILLQIDAKLELMRTRYLAQKRREELAALHGGDPWDYDGDDFEDAEDGDEDGEDADADGEVADEGPG